MFEFLVEAYWPLNGPQFGGPRLEDIAVAADQLTREGRQVRLLRAILVAEDETCFYLFEAGSREAVSGAATRSGLRFERLVEVTSPWTSARAERPTDNCLEAMPEADTSPTRGRYSGERGGSPLRY